MEPIILIYSFIVLFLGGVIKGGIGFGLPMIALSLLTMVNSIELSLSILTVPILVSSLSLALTSRNFFIVVKSNKIIILMLLVGILLGVSLLKGINEKYIYFILGVVIIFFTLLKKVKIHQIKKPNRFIQVLLEIIVGLGTGMIGGMTTVMSPLVVTYLSAFKTDKNIFVSTLNTIMMFGGIFLITVFTWLKIYTFASFSLSVAACLPVLLGVYCGKRIRNKINNQYFHQIIVVMLLIMGLNLLRKSLM